MKPLVTTALLFVSLMSVPPVSADMIELRTGQRVEGTFKGADDSAVKIFPVSRATFSSSPGMYG